MLKQSGGREPPDEPGGADIPVAVVLFLAGGLLFLLSSSAVPGGASVHLLRCFLYSLFLGSLYLAVKFGGRYAGAVVGGFFAALALLDLIASQVGRSQ